MILIIDNYDSFVHNLARYCRQLGSNTQIFRCDQISVAQIVNLNPQAIVISPGPCTPNEAGVSLDVVRKLGHQFPILGVCLGHQVIAQAFGAVITKAIVPMHGKSSTITHDGTGIFREIKSPLTVARYHSLIVSPQAFPATQLRITGYSEEGEIMALAHHQLPIYGLQFHPESVLTEQGYQLIENFLKHTHRSSRHAI